MVSQNKDIFETESPFSKVQSNTAVQFCDYFFLMKNVSPGAISISPGTYLSLETNDKNY